MTENLLSRRNLSFLLFELLKVDEFARFEAFENHDRSIYEAVLDLYERIASDHFLPHAADADACEPSFDGEVISVHPDIAPALSALAKSGLMAANRSEQEGGFGLPNAVERAGVAYLMAANPATAGYAFLTIANMNLLVEYASPEQVRRYVPPMLEGRFFGTMCLSEPQAGSSLADIRTRAVRKPDGSYRLFGNKMWISGGDHSISENIVHAVLAKIPEDDGTMPPGTRGISLFIVPRMLVNDDGSLGERNDISTAGLNHKMGHRGTVNCALNFGEGLYHPNGEAGAVGEMIGEPGAGLRQMFHMMNEARIGVGLGAAAIGSAGYLAAVDYAHTRAQGRLPDKSNASGAPVAIIEHADVKRMLLASKAYVEGGLALALFGASLIDVAQHAGGMESANAKTLLDYLTPIIKSWPSRWCLEANDLAIQVHGGYGYTRDFPLERYWRDNRLNAIHEGTYGIHALTMVKRGLSTEAGSGLTLLFEAAERDIAEARQAGIGERDLEALIRLRIAIAAATRKLAAISDESLRVANASAYFDTLGHFAIGVLWLRQAVIAAERITAGTGADTAFYEGKLSAFHYFIRWEIPQALAWLEVVESGDDTVVATRPEMFST